MSKFTVVLILALVALFEFVGCYETCDYLSGGYYTYCEDGYYCCNNDLECCKDTVLSIGAYVGIAIGVIVFFAIIGAVIAGVKSTMRPRVMVQPNVATIATVQTGVPGTYPQGPYTQAVYPPAYPPAYPPV